jgi:Ca-activated chloride channel family protein
MNRKAKRTFFLLIFTILLVPFSIKLTNADGMIVIPKLPPVPVVYQPPTPFPLEVRYHRVVVAINDQVAKTEVDQEFYNPTNARLEGMYVFPIPEGAALDDFSMNVDGRMVSAELLDARKARSIYEDIVRQTRDPALLEYSGKGAFKVHIFPIDPRSGKRVKLSYTEALKADSGVIAYTYPLNTEKFSAKPLEDVSIRIDLNTTGKLKTIFSPTHNVEVKRHSDYKAVIGFEARNVRPDTDFTVYYGTDEAKIGLNLLTHHPPGEEGYFLLTASPSFGSAEKDVIPKDITFVLDTSGSMVGEKMNQARKALLFCLENLNPEDRFEMVRFSTEAETLFGRLQQATSENVEKARQFTNRMKPIGGTNIEEALVKALEGHTREGSRPQIIVFITDGKPTIGETNEESLIKKVKSANSLNIRIFTFGIGDDLNTHLLDRITEETKAYRTYVRPEEDMELKISSFYEKIKSPVMVDLKLHFSPGIRVSKMYPRDLPDLFAGTQLTLFGRYDGNEDVTIALEGWVGNQKAQFDYPVTFPARNDANAFIASLWATQRVGYLLDQIRLHGRDRELIDEITELARRYGIVTPYTSYLIMEDENVRLSRNELRREDQTLNVPPQASSAFREQAKKDFDAMVEKSGPRGVIASKEVEALKNAKSFTEIYQGQSRLNYTDKEGKVQNLVSQTKNIQGRALYQAGNFWVDSKIQTLKNQQAVKRIQFASSEYFALLEKEPESAQFMALGKNVRFVVRDIVYEIFE